MTPPERHRLAHHFASLGLPPEEIALILGPTSTVAHAPHRPPDKPPRPHRRSSGSRPPRA